METPKYEVFEQIAGKVDCNIVDIDLLVKDVLKDKQNKDKVTKAIKNEISDIQSNLSGLKREDVDKVVNKLNMSFNKYSKNEQISSDKLIEEISKISSPKAQEIIAKHEVKKIIPTRNKPQAKQEEEGWVHQGVNYLVNSAIGDNNTVKKLKDRGSMVASAGDQNW